MIQCDCNIIAEHFMNSASS